MRCTKVSSSRSTGRGSETLEAVGHDERQPPVARLMAQESHRGCWQLELAGRPLDRAGADLLEKLSGGWQRGGGRGGGGGGGGDRI